MYVFVVAYVESTWRGFDIKVDGAFEHMTQATPTLKRLRDEGKHARVFRMALTLSTPVEGAR